jgi:hypothetical protein
MKRRGRGKAECGAQVLLLDAGRSQQIPRKANKKSAEGANSNACRKVGLIKKERDFRGKQKNRTFKDTVT